MKRHDSWPSARSLPSPTGRGAGGEGSGRAQRSARSATRVTNPRPALRATPDHVLGRLFSRSEGVTRTGFALVELLVALAIFAVIGVIAYTGLASVARARGIVGLESARLADAQFAIALFERDLRQSVARTVRGEYGETLPALDGARERIELTSHAFASPQGGAALARLAWAAGEDGLARVAWVSLDRAPSARTQRRVLAPGVESMRLRYLDASQNWREAWPPQPRRDHLERLPRAVELTLVFEGIGELRRLVDLVEPETVTPP